jgi:hypothetical protein
MATSGKISNWDITDAGLTNVTETGDACIILNREYESGNSDFVSMGIRGGTLYSSLLTSSNIEPKGVQNVGIEIEARNGTAPDGAPTDFANIALRAHGTSQLNGPVFTIDDAGSAVKGATQTVQYNRGDEQFTLIFKNGIFVGNESGWI